MNNLRTQREIALQRSNNILDSTGKPMAVTVTNPVMRDLRFKPPGRSGRSGIDAAVDNRHTSNHYGDADGRPIDSVLMDDRDAVRNRLRYEYRNNGLMKHMVDQISSDVVGTGPRPQFQLGESGEDEQHTDELEERFGEWAETAMLGPGSLAELGGESLGDDLQLTVQEDCLAGELFDIITTTDVAYTPMKLRLMPIQPERVGSPYAALDGKIVDGVETDDLGRIKNYYILDSHPQSPKWIPSARDYKAVPVADVIHYYRALEPNQHRGFPRLSPGLPIAAQRRRWSLAVLSAAESAADLSVIFYCTHPNVNPQALDGLDSIPFERNMATNAPAGYAVEQLKPQQPTATHKEYDKSLIADTGLALGMPPTVASMDASDANMSSARRDDLLYMMACRVERKRLVRRKLRRIALAWLREAQFVHPNLAWLRGMDLRKIALDVEWYWDERDALDELKTEKARTEGLHNGTRNEIDELKKLGVDYRKHRQKILKIQRAKLNNLVTLLAEFNGKLTPEQVMYGIEQKPAQVVLNMENIEAEETDSSKKDSNV